MAGSRGQLDCQPSRPQLGRPERLPPRLALLPVPGPSHTEIGEIDGLRLDLIAYSADGSSWRRDSSATAAAITEATNAAATAARITMNTVKITAAPGCPTATVLTATMMTAMAPTPDLTALLAAARFPGGCGLTALIGWARSGATGMSAIAAASYLSRGGWRQRSR